MENPDGDKPLDQQPNEGAREAAKEAVVPFFRKKGNRGNLRKREDDDEGGEDGPSVKRVDVKKGAALTFATQKIDKIETVQFAATRDLQRATDATRALETETEFDRDNRALRERVLKQAEEVGAGTEKDDGIYRGQTGYIDYKKGFRKEHLVGNDKGTGAHGPLRASVNVRMSIRMDYQPDVCKDYKETGYCGWGDSCKFMHDRGDYKAGWQIDRDWEEEQKKRRAAIAAGWNPDKEEGEDEEEEEDDGLPFACGICREAWEPGCDPVKTRCGHFFHEHCALRQNAKSGRCAICDKPTQGIFNAAAEIQLKIKKKKQADERKAKGE